MHRWIVLSVLVWSCASVLAQQLPPDSRRALDAAGFGALVAWPELEVSAGTAYRTTGVVCLRLEELPEDRRVTIPRLANRGFAWRNSGSPFYLLGADGTAVDVALRPEPDRWTLVLPREMPGDVLPLLVLELEGRPRVFEEPAVHVPGADGTILLPAHAATITGERLRYEPQPHKNTVGYWTRAADRVHWELSVPRNGDYAVHLLQGCGKGQGGSAGRVSVGERSLAFTVEETGHFQNFAWRRVGVVALESGRNRLTIGPEQIAKNAFMDVRAVRLVPETTTDKIRVACVGDSITWGATVKDRARNCYPRVLGGFLGDRYDVVNFGRNAHTLMKRGDVPYWRVVPEIDRFAPNVVVIKLGSNDSKPHNWQHRDDFDDDLRALIEHFQGLPTRPVVRVCLPAAVVASNFGITQEVVAEQLPIIRAIAEVTGVGVIDTHAPFVGRADLMNADGVHPNAAGAKVLATTVRDGIVDLLAPRELRPNVVVFLTDDQGTLDAGCYGSDDLHTPNIDALAARGVRFTQAYAHLVCCPARALLMTGRHPQRSNLNQWAQADMHAEPGRNMDLEEITLAEALREAGYRTGLCGKWHLGAAPTHGPTAQGFDHFYGLRGGFIDNVNHFFLHGAGFHDLYDDTREVFERGTYFPDIVVREAERFLDKYQDQPFLLYVALNVPHYPEQPDPKFSDRYGDLPMPRRSYARMIATADDTIGRVLAKLVALELRDDTIVLFASDNGHSAERARIRDDGHNSGLAKGTVYGAHGGGGNTGKWRGHKGTFFEGGIRVPAILSYPKRLRSGAVDDTAITLADFYPTLLALCGVAPGTVELDGRSLMPRLMDGGDAGPTHDALHWQWFDRWAVREGDWKLIHDPRNASFGADRLFLGDLSGERPEADDHSEARPELTARLRELHDAWTIRVARRR